MANSDGRSPVPPRRRFGAVRQHPPALIVSETDATGSDIRPLCHLIGISIARAYRYSAHASLDPNCAPEPGPAGKWRRARAAGGQRGFAP